MSEEDKRFFVFADSRLGDIFFNILENSILHNRNEIKKIRIIISEALLDNKKFIKMQFKDNGVGINDKTKEMLLKQFFVKRDTFFRTGGIGVNLTLELLRIFDGKIDIVDNIKRDQKMGTKFIIWLPEANTT